MWRARARSWLLFNSRGVMCCATSIASLSWSATVPLTVVRVVPDLLASSSAKRGRAVRPVQNRVRDRVRGRFLDPGAWINSGNRSRLKRARRRCPPRTPQSSPARLIELRRTRSPRMSNSSFRRPRSRSLKGHLPCATEDRVGGSYRNTRSASSAPKVAGRCRLLTASGSTPITEGSISRPGRGAPLACFDG